MASWGLIEGTFDVAAQINRRVEREAHQHADGFTSTDA